MALRMMSAIVPGTQNGGETERERNHTADRQKLQEELLAAAKLCHARFGGRAELATESDGCVSKLCCAFEAIFRHGLRANRMEKLNSALRQVSDLVSGGTSRTSRTSGTSGTSGTSRTSSWTDVAFWPCIREQLTCHEQDRFTVLRKVNSDLGRGRAWLRAALNERSLERHLHALVDADTLGPFYEEWAFLRDQERSSVLPNVAAGLGTILFAIRIDNEELDDKSACSEIGKCRVSRSEPIISSVITGCSSINRDEKKKKVPTRIISFDNDDDDDDEEEDEDDAASYGNAGTISASAPPTCLNSPTVVAWPKDSTPANSSANGESQSETAGIIAFDVKPFEWGRCDSLEDDKVLTPVTDSGNMGGLVPVSPLDRTLDDMLVTLPPNYLDDGSEVTEAAVEASEPSVNGLEVHVDAENLDVSALRTRLMAMSEVLEQARDDAVTSRSQLARFQRQHQNHLERHELQLQALNRENELLRQQLRKYVTAVQMLRRDSDSTTVSDDDPSLDYHGEAQQYQEKLIQVAEMHAELMEFNARLTVQLTNRDRLVKLLQAELECLRGPLNEDDLPTEPPCLIHIWIPSAFLTGQTSDIHHVYQIHVRIRSNEWNIYRRYAQFYALYRELKKHDSIVTTFEFPPKKTLGNKDAKFVEDRRLKLQQWLRRVVGRLAQCSPAFTSRPSRQTLVSLMPFFGDLANNDDSRKNNTSRNAFSSSPQYMGL